MITLTPTTQKMQQQMSRHLFRGYWSTPPPTHTRTHTDTDVQPVTCRITHNCSLSLSDTHMHTIWDYTSGCQVRIPHISATFSLPLSLCLYPSLSFIPSVLSFLCPSPPHPDFLCEDSSCIKVAEILILPEVCAPSVGIKNQVEDRWRGRDTSRE